MADNNEEKKEFDYKAVSSKLYQASPRGAEKDLIKCGYVFKYIFLLIIFILFSL